MLRRKSRLSTFGPTTVDIDYRGDTGALNHMIQTRRTSGSPSTSEVNFAMQLRGYRNISEFKASKPWNYPPHREFSPED